MGNCLNDFAKKGQRPKPILLIELLPETLRWLELIQGKTTGTGDSEQDVRAHQTPYTAIIHLLRWAKESGLHELGFTGHEPTWHTELPEIVALARCCGIVRPRIFTQDANLLYDPLYRKAFKSTMPDVLICRGMPPTWCIHVKNLGSGDWGGIIADEIGPVRLADARSSIFNYLSDVLHRMMTNYRETDDEFQHKRKHKRGNGQGQTDKKGGKK